MFGIFLRYTYENKEVFFSKHAVETIRIITIISVVFVSLLFFFDYPNVYKSMFYVLNLNLLVIIIHDAILQKIPESRILEFIGKYSLPIYLYHVMCQLVAVGFLKSGTLGYYIICMSAFIILCVIIYFLRRIRVINVVLFGSTFTYLDGK